jgi:hypothetical protein
LASYRHPPISSQNQGETGFDIAESITAIVNLPTTRNYYHEKETTLDVADFSKLLAKR